MEACVHVPIFMTSEIVFQTYFYEKESIFNFLGGPLLNEILVSTKLI